MLQRTILRLLQKPTNIPRYPFSTNNPTPPSQKDQQQKQSDPKTPPERQRREGE